MDWSIDQWCKIFDVVFERDVDILSMIDYRVGANPNV